MNIEHSNPMHGGNISNFHMPALSKVRALFPQFLKQNPAAIKMINKITYQEKIKFRMENREEGIKFMNYLKEHPEMSVNTLYTSSNHSKYIAMKGSPASYPGDFPMWCGYTNTGTVSILPHIPVASALSSETHDLSGKIGWNSWGTVY